VLELTGINLNSNNKDDIEQLIKKKEKMVSYNITDILRIWEGAGVFEYLIPFLIIFEVELLIEVDLIFELLINN
jgi:hypothetical protein